jgi:hypothetical protein
MDISHGAPRNAVFEEAHMALARLSDLYGVIGLRLPRRRGGLVVSEALEPSWRARTPRAVLIAGILVATAFVATCDHPLALLGTRFGTLGVLVSGLNQPASSGGDVTVARTDTPSGTLTIPIPGSGSFASDSVPPGTYQLGYTAPSGYALASGSSTRISRVTVGQTTTDTFHVQAAAGFATPDILNDASFEVGDSPDVWDGFTDWTGTTGSFPFGTGGGFNCTRSTTQAFAGSYSVRMDYSTTSGQGIRMLSPQFPGKLHVFYRVYFYVAPGSTIPTQSHKWLRAMYTLVGVDGGLYLDFPGGGVSWANVESNPGNAHIPLNVFFPTAGVWHWIEVEYDRTSWNTLPGPRARFWYDGTVLVGGKPQLNATSFWGDDAATPAPDQTNPTSAYPWIYANGTAAAAHPIIGISFDDTFNSGSTGSGTFYYDKVAISTQRIGP